MLRFREGAFDDRYISPFNGRTEELVVQAVDKIYDDASSHATWHRTFVRDISPWHLRIGNWPVSHIDYQATSLTARQWALFIAKYIPASIALMFVVCIRAELTQDSVAHCRRSVSQGMLKAKSETEVVMTVFHTSFTAIPRYIMLQYRCFKAYI